MFENLKYLQDQVEETDNEELLKYAIFYDSAFTSSHEQFKTRLDLLMEMFPDWETIISKQFWSYDGFSIMGMSAGEILGLLTVEKYVGSTGLSTPPILQAIGWESDDAFNEILEQLNHPETMIWKFIEMIEAVWNEKMEVFTDDLDELLEYEESKHEIGIAAKTLKDMGLSLTAFCTILEASYVLTSGIEDIINRLTACFGENFIDVINEMEQEELSDKACDL